MNDDEIEEVKRGFLVAKRLGAGFDKRDTNSAAISVEEIMALHYVFASGGQEIKRVAELGTFLGHTANIIADMAPRDCQIEIYDLFEHNDFTKKSLKNHPLFSEADFFDIWKDNTKRNASRFDVLRGNIVETATQRHEPIDLLFVDVVKHVSLVNLMNNVFYDRLRVGGYLLHQDYYHYQSPWLVYQMEHLSDAFALVGDFGNNMSAYVKKRELTDTEKNFDFVGGLTNPEKYALMDQAIDRYPGLRAGNLLASKLRLSMSDDCVDSEKLFAHIMSSYDNARIHSYAMKIMKEKDSIDKKMW